jgi:hypothetical protein
MTLEQQVCSLELAKKLKELGVKQKSMMYFCSDIGELTYSKDCSEAADSACRDHLRSTITNYKLMALDRNKFKMKGSAEQEWDRMWPEKDHPLKESDSIQGTFKGVVTNYGSNNSNVWFLEVRARSSASGARPLSTST